MAKILIVEDDKDLSDSVADILRFEHHNVEQIHNGQDALDNLLVYVYDLVILDWELPGLNGVEILKRVRDQGKSYPILMLTGRSAIEDKTTGLDGGADDYLPKPFDMKELSSRIRALLRRSQKTISNQLKVDDLTLDLTTSQVKRGEQEIKLLRMELALFEFLLRHKGQAFNVEDLLDRVWPSETESTHDAVRQTVIRLRKKIDKKGEPSIITTAVGIGYKIDEDR